MDVVGTMVLALVVGGCGTGSSDVAIERATNHQLKQSVPGTPRVVHDFGLVRPESKHNHVFEIRNAGSTTWSIRRIHVTCACTVPNISSNTIEPGEVATVEVKYRAGTRSVDDTGAVLVEFEEDDAPRIELLVKASIRAPMIVDPMSLTWIVSKGERLEKVIYVNNFSENTWGSLPIECTVPWITATADLMSVDAFDSAPPRQRWRLAVCAEVDDLGTGKHEGTLHIWPGSMKDKVTEVPVGITVKDPVAAVPEVLFFGNIEYGESSTSSTDLVFQSESDRAELSEPKLTHDMGEQLELQCFSKSATVLRLIGVLKPTRTGLVRGEVTVAFDSDYLPQVTIPVWVSVNRKDG